MICIYCRHFSPAIPQSRMCPQDPACCGHPTLFALMTANMNRGAIRKCKGFEPKRTITYRQVQNLDKDHPLTLAFEAQENRLEQAIAEAGCVIPSGHNEPGSLAEFNRYIAGDR